MLKNEADRWSLGAGEHHPGAAPPKVVEEKKGRRVFSRGVWADGVRVAELRAALEAERGTPAYAKRLAAGRKRAARKQEAYTGSFHEAGGGCRGFWRG